MKKMNVLHIATLTTDKSVPALNKLSSGYGLMINDIITSLNYCPEINVDIFLLKRPFLKIENQHYRQIRIKDILKSLIYGNYSKLFYLIKQYGKSIKNLRDIVYYYGIVHGLTRILTKEDFDLIHIHGCGFWNTYIIDLCNKLNKKYIFTLHGLNSFERTDLNSQEKLYEREFLKTAYENDINLTVVSTGCKKSIESFLHDSYNYSENKTKVIYNGAHIGFINDSEFIDVRETYNIPNDKPIILYVGNINYNKNQIGFIDGYNCFRELYNIDAYILFIGRNDLGDQFLKELRDSKHSNMFRVCGNIPKDKMNLYYQQADGIALISKSEGFGLSLVEGMMVGKPCLMVEDMAAFDDIFDRRCCVKISSRDKTEIAEGIYRLLSSKWDNDYIIRYSKKFSLQAMARKYIDLYKEISSK